MNKCAIRVLLHPEDEPAHAAMIHMASQRSVGDVRPMQVDAGKVALNYLYRRGIYADPAVAIKPALILLDLRMPRISDINLAAAISCTSVGPA